MAKGPAGAIPKQLKKTIHHHESFNLILRGREGIMKTAAAYLNELVPTDRFVFFVLNFFPRHG